jgi:hypothetical protein
MKLELKNLKHSKFASHETHCFEAKLYVNGVFSATLSNNGQGGSNYVWWEKGVPISEEQVEDYLAKNVDTMSHRPEEWKELASPFCLEFWVGDEVNLLLATRELKKDLKKKILFKKGKELWEWKSNSPITPSIIEEWKEKNPQVTEILNTMEFEKALELYRV